jgi:hypothetical protein
MVVVDIDLARIRIKVDVRHIAIAIARTCSLLSDFIFFTDNLFQNYLRLAGSYRNFFMKHFASAKSSPKPDKQFRVTGKSLFLLSGTDCISLDLLYRKKKNPAHKIS